MRLVGYEIKKLFKNRLYLVLAALLLLGNLLLASETDRLKNVERVTNEADVQKYERFLEQVPEQAERLRRQPLYRGTETFRRRSLDKAVEDYATLFGMVEIRPGDYTALSGYSLYSYGILFALVFVCLTLWHGIAAERRRGLFLILKCTRRGHCPLALSKLVSALVLSVLFVLLEEVSVLALLFVRHGSMDFGASVQSLTVFRDCALPVSAGGAIALTILFRLSVIAFAVLLMGGLLLAVRQDAIAVLLFAGFVIAEFVIRRAVPSSSAANHLTVLNIFYLTDMRLLLGDYLNLDFFGWPVGQLLAGGLVWLFGLIPAAIGVFCFARRCQAGTAWIFERLVLAVRRRLRFLWHDTGVAFFEARKLFLHQKRWLLLAVLVLYVVMAVGNAMEPLRFTKLEDVSYHQLMGEISGPVTGRTETYLEGKQKELDVLYEQANASTSEGEQMVLMAEISALEGGLSKVNGQLAWLEYAGGGAMGKCLVNELAYQAKLSDYAGSILAFLAGGAAITIFCCSMDSYDRDKRMDGLLASTRAGKRGVKKGKRLVASIFALAAVLGTCIPEIIGWVRIDGFVNLGADLSLSQQPFFQANCTLGVLLGLVLLIRMAAYLLLTLIIFKFTSVLRQGMLVLGASLLVLGVPVLILFLAKQNIPMLLLELL